MVREQRRWALVNGRKDDGEDVDECRELGVSVIDEKEFEIFILAVQFRYILTFW